MENTKKKISSSIKPYGKIISVLFFSITIYILAAINNSLFVNIMSVTTYYPKFFPAMYIEGKELTKIKIVLKYVIIDVLGISFIMLLKDYKKTNSRTIQKTSIL